MPENWLLFTPEREGTPIATILVAIQATDITTINTNTFQENLMAAAGALWNAKIFFHLEACYY